MNTIYDLGVHTGMDSLYYLKKGFKVIGIEANPRLVNKIKNKLNDYIEQGKFILINKAITNKTDKKIDFYINEKKKDWGTVLSNWNRTMNNKFKKISVETITLQKIIETYGLPYYLKIDIEGSDVLILDSLLEINEKPKYLSIELLSINNLKNEKIDYLEILNKLKKLGYNKFILYNQAKKREVLKPSLEGKTIDYNFTGHCSGLFGKDIFESENEVNFEYLKEKYIEHINKKINNELFNLNCWYDIHCTF